MAREQSLPPGSPDSYCWFDTPVTHESPLFHASPDQFLPALRAAPPLPHLRHQHLVCHRETRPARYGDHAHWQPDE